MLVRFFFQLKLVHLPLIMDLVKLSIRGISYSSANSEAYILILEEDETQKKIPIVIGNFEAQQLRWLSRKI